MILIRELERRSVPSQSPVTPNGRQVAPGGGAPQTRAGPLCAGLSLAIASAVVNTKNMLTTIERVRRAAHDDRRQKGERNRAVVRQIQDWHVVQRLTNSFREPIGHIVISSL